MFNNFLNSCLHNRRLHVSWCTSIPGLIRVPLFSAELDRGFVVSYIEKTRKYELISFNPHSGQIEWRTNLVNGGYGSLAIGRRIIAVPTKFVDVTGVNAEDGTIAWCWKGDARVRSPIGVCDDGFIFSCGSKIIGVSENGEEWIRIEKAGFFLWTCRSCGAERFIGICESCDMDECRRTFPIRRIGFGLIRKNLMDI